MSCVGLWSSHWSVVISWLVVYGHVLGGSVVIFCALDRGLWSCPEWVCDHVLLSRSVIISWLVVFGRFLDGSVVICWVCGHFLDRGL